MRETPSPTEGKKTVQESTGSHAAAEVADYGVDEKRLLRRLDVHIIPLVMTLYLFSFLDRCVSFVVQQEGYMDS